MFLNIVCLIATPWIVHGAEAARVATSDSLRVQLGRQAVEEGWLNLPALEPNILLLTKTKKDGVTKSYLSVQKVSNDSRVKDLEKKLNDKIIKRGEKFGYLVLMDDPEYGPHGVVHLKLQESDTKAVREQTWFFGKARTFTVNEWGPERVTEKTHDQIQNVLSTNARAP